MPVVGSNYFVDSLDAKHAISVRRMRVGEAIQLTDGKGLRLKGLVSKIDGQSILVEAQSVEVEQPSTLSLGIIQALAKGDRDELSIQAATELGVLLVCPWQSERSISRWEGPKVTKGLARWQAIVAEAAKQSLRVFEPTVVDPQTSKQLSQSISEGAFGMVLVLDPTSALPLTALIAKMQASHQVAQAFGSAQQITVVVGPEGGITDAELADFEAAGAHRVRLGSEILRTSTAGVAALAAIQAILGSWR
ncbi:MAG: hypothetical protein RLZ28_1232 [Actinomycetota bacterium]